MKLEQLFRVPHFNPTGIVLTAFYFRRQCYELYRCETYEMIIHSASHLKIGIDKIPADIFIRFPNVTKLTLIENDIQSNEQRSIMNINRIIPLIQLTHLVIFDRHFDIIQLIEFLRFSSNIQSVTFMGVSFIDLFCLSIEQIDLVNCISKTSKVTKLCIQDDCSLEYVQFFVKLCPRLQKVEIVPLKRQIESIVRFLLSSNVPDLFRLSLQSITFEMKIKLQKMIDHDKLICDYSIKDDYACGGRFRFFFCYLILCRYFFFINKLAVMILFEKKLNIRILPVSLKMFLLMKNTNRMMIKHSLRTVGRFHRICTTIT